MKKILSIDGGGIRGIIPGEILKALEQKLQEKTNNPDSRLADYFDFFAGTSTGGILTCLLLCPDEEQPLRPKFSAAEAVQLYKTLGGEIFKTSLWSRTINFKSLFSEKYSSVPLENDLKKYFASTRLSQLLKPCIIPSYNIQERKTHFFAQQDYLRYGDGTDFYLKEVCRATSAAPTYFEPALVKSISGVSYPMIDGGMFANNPSLCAYSEVRNSTGAPSAKDMFIISIGTGSESLPYPYKKAKKWGGLGWIKPSIDIMMSGAAETTHYHMLKMFEANGNRANYIRIQPANLRNANPEMDDASVENRQALSEVGIKTAQECDRELDKIIDKIIADQDLVTFDPLM